MAIMIVFNPGAYLEVINNPEILKGYERGGKEDMLKKGPVGYPKDFEHLEEIKYKHFIFSKNYKDSEISKTDFAQNVIADYQGLFPLVQYLNLAMSFSGNE